MASVLPGTTKGWLLPRSTQTHNNATVVAVGGGADGDRPGCRHPRRRVLQTSLPRKRSGANKTQASSTTDPQTLGYEDAK